MSQLTSTTLEDIVGLENPRKRLREEDDCEIDTKIIEEMVELNKRMEPKSPEEITEADTKEMSKKTFTLLCSFLPKILESSKRTKELTKQVMTLTTEVNSLKKDVTSLTKEVLNHEIQASSKCLIVRDLPKVGKETPLQLKSKFQEVLDDMECNVIITDIIRFKSNPSVANAGRSEHPPCKVEFISKFEKGFFLSKLKDLKRFKQIRITQDIPRLLQGSYKELDKKAYEIRKERPGYKTRVGFQGQKLILLAKDPLEQNFHEVEFN